MKKSLVLAMAMALGVTASAYAASPFSDVPAGHWAYDSVAKLAAAGVIDGYGDTTFGGDKLMTRYEMAQITARAMAKGANVDKLAAEFADELDNLGVRVANLEKKADNVKITGEIRARYVSQQGDVNKDGSGHHTNHDGSLRTRLWIEGQVNEDWTYTAMLQNTQSFTNDSENVGDEKVKFQRAYVDGKIGGVDVTAGRYNAFFGNGYVYDTRADAVELAYGKDIKVRGFVGRGTDAEGPLSSDPDTYGNYAGAEVNAKLGAVGLTAGYANFKDIFSENLNKGFDNAIWYVGADYAIGDVSLNAYYLKGDASRGIAVVDSWIDENIDDTGFAAGISYKGADAATPGSWGLFANYYNQGGQTYIAHTTDANVFDNKGFKGWGVGANYAVAKNIVAEVSYYDTEAKYGDGDDQKLYADLYMYF